MFVFKKIYVIKTVFAEGCKLLQAAALGNVDFLEILLTANPKNIHFRDYDRRTGTSTSIIFYVQ